jgi:Domain of unknown function (DUF4157)
MKAVQTKPAISSHANSQASAPFFQKKGSESHEAPERTAFFAGNNGVLGGTASPFFNKTSSPAIQTKLTIGQPGDKYEQEADAMAEKVVRGLSDGGRSTGEGGQTGGSPAVQMKCAECGEEEKLQMKKGEEGMEEELGIQKKAIFESNEEPPSEPTVQRMCTDCAAEEESVMKKSDGEASPSASPNLESRLNSTKGGGSPLPSGTRSEMEGAFGADFSGVRVHTGSSAVQLNQDLGAQAFAHGSDVYFGAGKYDEGSSSGKGLLAHELTHVVQQGGGSASSGKIQRACGIGSIGSSPPSTCNFTSRTPPGDRFLFKIGCDEFAAGEEARLIARLSTLPSGSTLRIVGMASSEGNAGFNQALACRRASAAQTIAASAGLSPSSVEAIGPVPNTHGDRFSRSVAVETTSPSTITFRSTAVSFLGCAPCNPYTDDGPAALSPPASEPGSGFRMKHFLEGSIVAAPGGTSILSSSLSSGPTVGITGFCGVRTPAHTVAYSTLGPTPLPAGAHGQGVEWQSQLSTQLGATVPPTIVGAPCGFLGTHPLVPPIMSRFFIRIFADGTTESGFLPCTTFPFHYLYDNHILKLASGAPVSHLVDFATWATSTGMPLFAAEIGFKALRIVCCHPTFFSGSRCPTVCTSGFSRPELTMQSILDPRGTALACAAMPAILATIPCPAACAPAGTACSTLSRPANP